MELTMRILSWPFYVKNNRHDFSTPFETFEMNKKKTTNY